MKKYFWAIGLGIVILAGFVFYQMRSSESTDDAFISGDIAPISTQVEGKITKVIVQDNQDVKAGDLLVEIDDKDYTYKRDMALAESQAAEAELTQAQSDAERYAQLFQKQEISKQESDRVALRVQNARAKALGTKAKLDLAQLDLDHTKVIAPIDGKISTKSVETGQYVEVGQPLLSIVSENIWVIANFKETQVKHMRPGEPVKIRVDAYPGVVFNGKIDSLQAGTGAAFSILPAQNASGNFIKVVQRVPVKITFNDRDPKYSLWPGLSVTPSVDVKQHKG